MATGETVTKTVWQYSRPLPEETMEFLRGIAADYAKVKRCTYERYSGIKSVDRLTPVYSILNEMRYCGLREQLNLPVVYYELAISDAVADIKGMWAMLKRKLNELITANENLTADDRQYLRTVLKINSTYAAILNGQEYEMPDRAKGLDIDVRRLNNLLCRLTRKYLHKPEVANADSFRITPAGYSYKDGNFRMVCRTPRRRVPIPMKDSRTFDRQLQVCIREDSIALGAPVDKAVRRHADYVGTVYIHIGNRDMFTLSNGHIYGQGLEKIVDPETERLNGKNRMRGEMYRTYEKSAEEGSIRKAETIKANNLGSRKYDRQKEKERARTETFINSEINRMLREEKPGKIVITKPVIKNRTNFHVGAVNRKLARNFGGYVRKRLRFKCRLNSIELVEINSKGTGSICACCGAEGKRTPDGFICESCGVKTTTAFNSARNIEKKYREM